MIRTLSAFAAFLTLGSAAAAQAGVTVASTPYAAFNPAAHSAVIDFDHALPAGFTLTGGLVRNVDDALGAQPAIAPGVKGTSMYWSINAGDAGTLMSAIGYQSVSFLWGSMDTYNTLSLLNADGSVMSQWTGAQAYTPSNGDQYDAATNRRVTFRSDGAAIYGLRLESGQPAFEVDDVAFAQAVPEPATWGMLLMGFAGLGAVLRRRRRPLQRIRFA